MKVSQALKKAEQKGQDFAYLICYDEEIGWYTDSLYIAKIGGYHNEHGQAFIDYNEADRHYKLIDQYTAYTSKSQRDSRMRKLKREGVWKE